MDFHFSIPRGYYTLRMSLELVFFPARTLANALATAATWDGACVELNVEYSETKVPSGNVGITMP